MSQFEKGDLGIPARHGERRAKVGWWRVVVHAGIGLVILGLYLAFLRPQHAMWMSGAILASLLLFESLRLRCEGMNRWLFDAFPAMYREQERGRWSSAVPFWLGMLIVSLTCEPAVFASALALLSVADKCAAIIGGRWGRRALINGRTWEGSAAFFLSAFLAALLVLRFGLRFGFEELTLAKALWVALAGALSGMLAEIFSRRLDDNVTVGVLSGLSMQAAMTWI